MFSGPLPAAPLAVRPRYLAVVPRPLPPAPLVVRRRYLVVVPRPLPRCASQVLDRDARHPKAKRATLFLAAEAQSPFALDFYNT